MKINWKAIPEAIKVLGRFGEKHLPSILTGLGVAGFIGTAVLAAKEAPRAETAIRKAERELVNPTARYADDEELVEIRTLTKWEKLKLTSGYYWPSVALGTASAVCVLSAHKIDLTRLASVTAAYQLSKKDLKDLKDKIVEKDGKEKLKEYEHSINQDYISNSEETAIWNTGHGHTIFKFGPTGQLFYSNHWHVETALREAILETKREGEYPLSELIYGLGLPSCPIAENEIFVSESFSDIDANAQDLRSLFDYCSVNSSEGDNRSCTVISLGDDRLINRVAYYDMGSKPSFRYR